MRVLLIVYDNNDPISDFPLGIAYIASAIRNVGHEVEIYSQDIYHYSSQHLTDYLNKKQFDVVGCGACGGYYQYKQVLSISEAINKAKHKPLFILGGALVSPEPEYFLRKFNADYIVIGEGEQTIVDILHGFFDLGVAYLQNGRYVNPNDRPVIKNIDSIAFPAWDLFPIEHYVSLAKPNSKRNHRYLPMLSSRGCTHHCNFCYRMDKGYRIRSSESIIEELQKLKTDYHINYIEFQDELLMCSEKRTIELCEAIIKADLGMNLGGNGRLNYAKPEVLKAMKKAGFVFMSYGIESLDDSILKVMHKQLTVEQITEGIKNTLKAGISPGFGIIFGNIGETEDILNKGVDFLVKYEDQVQLRTIRPVTPYPGTELYYQAIEKGLLKDVADFYENKHLNSDLICVNFTDLSDSEFYRVLHKANTRLVNNYFDKQKKRMRLTMNKLYFEKDSTFRGFR